MHLFLPLQFGLSRRAQQLESTTCPTTSFTVARPAELPLVFPWPTRLVQNDISLSARVPVYLFTYRRTSRLLQILAIMNRAAYKNPYGGFYVTRGFQFPWADARECEWWVVWWEHFLPDKTQEDGRLLPACSAHLAHSPAAKPCGLTSLPVFVVCAVYKSYSLCAGHSNPRVSMPVHVRV